MSERKIKDGNFKVNLRQKQCEVDDDESPVKCQTSGAFTDGTGLRPQGGTLYEHTRRATGLL